MGYIFRAKKQGLMRVVMTEGEALKDVILRDILPYLKVSKSVSSTPKSTSSSEKTDNDKQGTPPNEEGLLFDNILETYKFRLKGAGVSNSELTKPILTRTQIFHQLKPENGMYLSVQLPLPQKKSYSFHARPLTIDG